MAMYIVKPWYKKEAPPVPAAIYGAEWAGTSDPSWTRTDNAVGFSAPNPYYSGMSGSPSSPFDNIMPWSGMRRVTDASAGELVEIPKFYYKWIRDGVKMKLQISISAFDGSHVSPAHADRGDGVGERDYVYIGRYHCASDYKSKTGVTPITNITRATARTGIHNIGSNIWQNDYALYWTVRMLYLVEFANWNSQLMIGYGCGNGSTIQNTGSSDSIPYHTGTIQASRSTYGVGCEYRYIEGLWDGCFDFVDGIRLNNLDIHNIKNPADFSDTENGVKVGERSATDGYTSSWTDPSNITGYEYALFPYNKSGSDNTYICDDSNDTQPTSGKIVTTGASYLAYNQSYGLFCEYSFIAASFTSRDQGTRLMVLPPSRLSA